MHSQEAKHVILQARKKTICLRELTLTLYNVTQAQGPCCTAYFHGKAFTSVDQLSAALDKQVKPSRTPELYPFDHIFSSDPQTSLKLWQSGNASAAVLYGIPGTECFMKMDQLLRNRVTQQHASGKQSYKSSFTISGAGFHGMEQHFSSKR